jgi:hypothetical protein
VGFISLAPESLRSIAWACRLLPLGGELCPLGFRALLLLAEFMAAELTTVPIFKIRILTGLGLVTSIGVPFGLGACWAAGPVDLPLSFL